MSLDIQNKSLNIKNKEVYALASYLAEMTGRSMTSIVLDALRRQQKQLLRGENTEERVQEWMAIAERCAKQIRQPVSAVEHGDMLYGENGMAQ
ncbi:MAG: type II toxin-antitoxin system VapB family antitoxin [Caldilineaceae bacterium]|nr:type II toxin-antitoxin system VapB family antitoxin [Caldilineaceae bacterium]HRJ43237.1 type II toxin-antitoxin system VapB family antitoxin [Caldilineaceae bacterium]